MKFWELTAAFRSESENLVSVLSKPEWEKYKNYYTNLDKLVMHQDRKILDEVIPLQLATEVCELSKLKFYLYYKETPQCLASYQLGDKEPFEEVSPLDILFRFGGSCIEETIERTTCDVMFRKLDAKIEVLGAFNITNLGMIAFLRTEGGKLKDNSKICSLDGLRDWTVIKEPFMFIDPVSAYIKQEHQKEQGIRQYIIEPKQGVGKPGATEILRIKSGTEEIA